MRLIFSALFVCSFILAIGCEGRDEDSDNADDGGGLDTGDLTDGEIAQAMRSVNLGEIAQANVARPRLTTATARDFADRMIDEHTQNNAELTQIVEDLAIGFAESDLSQDIEDDSERLVSEVQRATLQTIDEVYLETQVSSHTSALALIEDQLLPEALEDDLEDFLADTRDIVAEHLDDAQTALDDVVAAE